MPCRCARLCKCRIPGPDFYEFCFMEYQATGDSSHLEVLASPVSYFESLHDIFLMFNRWVREAIKDIANIWDQVQSFMPRLAPRREDRHYLAITPAPVAPPTMRTVHHPPAHRHHARVRR